MFGVTVRFLSALVGSLAAFFLVAHAAHAGGLIGAYSVARVDEFYTLAVRPITTMEAATRQTLLVVSAALVGQGLVIAVLFARWGRPPAVKPLAVEYASRQAPDRLRGDAYRYAADLHESGRYDRDAGEVTAYTHQQEAVAPVGRYDSDIQLALSEMPDRFRVVRAGEKV
jgi:hypothetical protein